MPGKANVSLGNLALDTGIYLPSVTFPTLGANASSSTTVTAPGVQALDLISWNMQAPPAHLTIDNIYVSAPNQITILWGTDGTGVTGATVPVLLGISRIDGANLGVQALPQALV